MSRAMAPILATVIALAAAPSWAAGQKEGEKVGQRPYEMVWAARTEDEVPANVDFEDLAGWRVEAEGAVGGFERSREEQLWGRHVGKLTYRRAAGEEGKPPAVTIRPPQPIPIAGPFDCIRLWAYGNNWSWAPDPATPPVETEVLVRSPAGGAEAAIRMGRVHWKEWWLMHRKLGPAEAEPFRRGGSFTGLRVVGGTNQADRVLYFDNLAFYAEKLSALRFPPRPRRGIDLPPGQSPSLNTGPGRLPFPTREQTILPDNLAEGYKTSLRQDGNAFLLEYAARDGRLRYRYEPSGPGLGSVTVQWNDRKPFAMLAGGGLRLAAVGGAVEPERCEPLGCRRDGDAVVARSRLHHAGRAVEATYALRLWAKSLVIDVACGGGQVAELSLGKAVGCEDPRLLTLPYLVGGAERPAVVVMGPPDAPLFLSGLMDHTRSNASSLTFTNRIDDSGVAFNGGAAYLPKTDGRRNDCFERIFLTVSPVLEEVLPNIPNPPSPWMHVAGERLWRAHAASDRRRDYEEWADLARYGMTQVVITDHETGWRDGGESFTFRTRAAPGKGGDGAQADYARKLHALGFRYGIYNNYTDFAPVNEHWHPDMVTRLPDGNWRTAWARCYNPKPARSAEYEAALAPIIQGKFALSTAYCDVHTAVRPWDYVDYDARVPGAGTFAQTFYCYGEIMLHQKATWNGPVYSEGGNHWYYCGLTDGNYGQDRAAGLAEGAPWLVDFDLRKMHPLGISFGMGNLEMFFGRNNLGSTPQERDRRLDRFLAATVAFGHTGFLVREGGIRNAVRSYHLLQQLAGSYAGQKVRDIRYADAAGRLLDTSAAVASGAHRRSQLKLAYEDGLEVWVNGHPSEVWPTPHAELPPNGFFARSADGKLAAWSAASADTGRRADYVDSPAYVYADGRGRLTRLPNALTDEAVIAVRRGDGKVEVIPVGGPKVAAVGLNGRAASAVALDKARGELGPAEVRWSRGLAHVMGVNWAFSYLLTPAEPPTESLACERASIVPGEAVSVRRGRQAGEFRAPADARPGQLLWHRAGDAWIDFAVEPLAQAALEALDHGGLRLRLRSRLGREAQFAADFLGQRRQVRIPSGGSAELEFPAPDLDANQVQAVRLSLAAGELSMERVWRLAASRGFRRLADLPVGFQSGQRFRGRPEGPLTDGAIAARRSDMTCGEVRKNGLFMHPPWKGGVGYAYVAFEPVALPAGPPAAFRCSIGKENGSVVGDGILFRVAVVDEAGAETALAEKTWATHAWTALTADLAPWAGRRVRIKLIADVGAKDNSAGDWACWADCRIESREPTLILDVRE